MKMKSSRFNCLSLIPFDCTLVMRFIENYTYQLALMPMLLIVMNDEDDDDDVKKGEKFNLTLTAEHEFNSIFLRFLIFLDAKRNFNFLRSRKILNEV